MDKVDLSPDNLSDETDDQLYVDIDTLIDEYEKNDLDEDRCRIKEEQVTLNLMQTACVVCHNLESKICTKYQATYGVNICYPCLKGNEEYRLVTKTMLKEDFLLNETQINENLKHIEKKNEKYGGWAPIKLFLYCQARDLALRIHGSFSNIAKIRQEREVSRLETRIKRLKRQREDEMLLESPDQIPIILARRYREKKAAQLRNKQLRKEKLEAESKEPTQNQGETKISKKPRNKTDPSISNDKTSLKPKSSRKKKSVDPFGFLGTTSTKASGPTNIHIHDYRPTSNKLVEQCSICGATIEFENI